jgi:hypothetical protein
VSAYELAQLNVARLRAPLDSPLLADFVGALDRINALADRAEGFVWRLQDDSGNATALQPMGEDIIVNMSVWRDPKSLQAFVYRSDHAGVMRRRREWFEKMELFLVLWWVPRGHRPTVEEGIGRLGLLRERGPGEEAFTFGNLFAAPASASPQDAAASPPAVAATPGVPSAQVP